MLVEAEPVDNENPLVIARSESPVLFKAVRSAEVLKPWTLPSARPTLPCLLC